MSDPGAILTAVLLHVFWGAGLTALMIRQDKQLRLWPLSWKLSNLILWPFTFPVYEMSRGKIGKIQYSVGIVVLSVLTLFSARIIAPLVTHRVRRSSIESAFKRGDWERLVSRTTDALSSCTTCDAKRYAKLRTFGRLNLALDTELKGRHDEALKHTAEAHKELEELIRRAPADRDIPRFKGLLLKLEMEIRQRKKSQTKT